LDLTIKHQDNLAIKKIGLLKTWLVHHCETNQHNGIPTQVPNSMKIHPVFHVSLFGTLSCFYHLRKTHEPPPPIVIDDEQKNKVKEILDSRILRSQLQYLVHWQGYDINEHTWELIKNLSNAMEKVKDFHMWYLNKPKAVHCWTHC